MVQIWSRNTPKTGPTETFVLPQEVVPQGLVANEEMHRPMTVRPGNGYRGTSCPKHLNHKIHGVGVQGVMVEVFMGYG